MKLGTLNLGEDVELNITCNFGILAMHALHTTEEVCDRQPIEVRAVKTNARCVSGSRFYCKNEEDDLLRNVYKSHGDNFSPNPLGASQYHCVVTSFKLVSEKGEDDLEPRPIFGCRARGQYELEGRKVQTCPLTVEVLTKAIGYFGTGVQTKGMALKDLFQEYLKLVERHMPKTNKSTVEMENFIKTFMLDNLKSECDLKEYWGKRKINDVIERKGVGGEADDYNVRRFLRRFIHENWAYMTKIIIHVHDGQHRLTAGDHAFCGAKPSTSATHEDFGEIQSKFFNEAEFPSTDIHFRIPQEVSVEYFEKIRELSSCAQSLDHKAVPHGIRCMLHLLSPRIKKRCKREGLPYFLNKCILDLNKMNLDSRVAEGFVTEESLVEHGFSSEKANGLIHMLRDKLSRIPASVTGLGEESSAWDRNTFFEVYNKWFANEIFVIVVEELVDIKYYEKWSQSNNQGPQSPRAKILTCKDAFRKAILEILGTHDLESIFLLTKKHYLEHYYRAWLPLHGNDEEQKYVPPQQVFRRDKRCNVNKECLASDVDVVQLLMLSRVDKNTEEMFEQGFSACSPEILQNRSNPDLKSEASFISAIIQSITATLQYYGKFFKALRKNSNKSNGNKALPMDYFLAVLSSKAFCDSVHFFTQITGYDPVGYDSYLKMKEYEIPFEDLPRFATTKINDTEIKCLIDHDLMKEDIKLTYKTPTSTIELIALLHSIAMKDVYEKSTFMSNEEDIEKYRTAVEDACFPEGWLEADGITWGPISSTIQLNALLAKFSNIHTTLFDGFLTQYLTKYKINSQRSKSAKFADQDDIMFVKMTSLIYAAAERKKSDRPDNKDDMTRFEKELNSLTETLSSSEPREEEDSSFEKKREEFSTGV